MHVDAIIIGAGQAGIPLAQRLAAAGRKVLLVERSRVGGTCVNYGCTPTKTLVASARAAHVARSARRLGVHADAVRVDFPAIIARKDAIVTRWREPHRRLPGGDSFVVPRSSARFGREREIERLARGTRHIVIDVGGRPVPPPIEGIASVPWLDNRRIMELADLPAHLIVLGGGYIGCEFAQMFRRFGSAVTVVQRGPHLLDREDEDVSQELEKVFRAEGIELLLGARVARAFAGAGSLVGVGLEDGKELVGSHLLAAVGRQPNTDDLGCAAGGVRLDAKGFVAVDDQYRTSAPGVYAVGDVARTRPRCKDALGRSLIRRHLTAAPRVGARGGSSRTACSRIRRWRGSASTSARHARAESATRWRRCHSATSRGRSSSTRPPA